MDYNQFSDEGIKHQFYRVGFRLWLVFVIYCSLHFISHVENLFDSAPNPDYDFLVIRILLDVAVLTIPPMLLWREWQENKRSSEFPLLSGRYEPVPEIKPILRKDQSPIPPKPQANTPTINAELLPRPETELGS